MCSIYAVPIAKLLGIKFVNGMITDAPSSIKYFGRAHIRARLTFLFSDVVLSNSYAGLRAYPVPRHKGCYIHNGFDFSRTENLASPDTVRKKFQVNTPYVVGMIAAFSMRKDYETFIMAAKTILQKRDDVTFLGIGDGSTLDKCREMVTGTLQSRVRLPGSQHDVESIINSFDIGVLVTNHRVHGEGISNAIMEYMALSKPVIATQGGGTGEIVIHNVNGFLVRPGHVADLAERIEFLLNHRDVARSMGEAGKQRIADNFSLERMVTRYVEIYEGLSNSPRAKSYA
jgi:glycosyltransferase involved in cell wall biosynthesis